MPVNRIAFLLIISLLSSLATAQKNSYDREWLDLLAGERDRAEKKIELRDTAEPSPLDVVYHRMEWEINPAVRFIEGTVTTHFVATEDMPGSITFDMHADLNVEQVTYHGTPLTNFDHTADHELIIELPAPLAANTLDSVAVTYNGIPPENGSGSFVQRTHGEEEVPVIWTLSEPYGQRDWWPGKQDLNDKIDSLDIIVSMPEANRVASNGSLQSEVVEGGRRIMQWKHRYPISSYLVAIAVTNYVRYTDIVPLDDGGSLDVVNYVYPEFLEIFQASSGKVVPMMQLYNGLFGLYPFAEEKYGHAQFQFPGGMEHQTMSFMFNMSDLLVAHELAHQWFGDKVTCGSWQDIWLNEGFASYLEGLIYENGLGNKTFRDWLTGHITNVTSDPGGSVWVDDTTSVSRIFSSRLSYSKGAMLVHMLRWELGDDAFFQGLRNYLNDPDLAFGFARTEDLKAHLEAVGGEDLTEFFDDWFYGQGYPSYFVKWNKDGQKIRMEIDQSTSHPSVDFYEMPLPIQLSNAEMDTIVIIDHTFSGQVVELELGFEPDSLHIDPDQWIISAGNEVQFTTALERPLDPGLRVSVYPNPTGGELFISPDPQVQFQSLRLLSMDGRQLLEMPFQNSISLEGLPSGIYILKLEGEQGVFHKRILRH